MKLLIPIIPLAAFMQGYEIITLASPSMKLVAYFFALIVFGIACASAFVAAKPDKL